jgi:hypothetical protein
MYAFARRGNGRLYLLRGKQISYFLKEKEQPFYGLRESANQRKLREQGLG